MNNSIEYKTKIEKPSPTETIIFSAITDGNLQKIKKFHDSKLINTVYSNGRTPLHKAASEGKIEIVKYLVEKNANITKQDIFGHTAIQSAIDSGHKEVEDYLKDQLEKISNTKSSCIQKIVALLRCQC